MRAKTLLMSTLGLGRAVVVSGWELHAGDRPRLEVRVRTRSGRRGRCGRCETVAPCYDRGGGERRWRHLDVGFATCELIADSPRVACPVHGPTVAAVPWARHDSAFTRAFEDLVVHDAVVGNKQAAAERYGISWRAVNNACVRVATEALARVDLLDGLVAVAIDEVKYKKGPALPDRGVRPLHRQGHLGGQEPHQGHRGGVLCRPGQGARGGAGLRVLRRRRVDPHRGGRAGARGRNGIAESNNAAIGRLRTNARGFHDPVNFITMIMLDRAGIRPDLPWRPGRPGGGAASTAA